MSMFLINSEVCQQVKFFNLLINTEPYDNKEFFMEADLDQYINKIYNSLNKTILNYSDTSNKINWVADYYTYKLGFKDSPRYFICYLITKSGDKYRIETRKFSKEQFNSISDISLENDIIGTEPDYEFIYNSMKEVLKSISQGE